MPERFPILALTLGLCVGAVSGFVIGLDLAQRLHPPLVGYECLAADGPLYAYEESDFPACMRIDRVH